MRRAALAFVMAALAAGVAAPAFDRVEMASVHLKGRDLPLHVARREVSHAAWQSRHAAGASEHLPPACRPPISA